MYQFREEVLRGYFDDVKQRFELDYAMSGEQALEKLNAQIYDVVILDLMMPGMCGNEVTRSLSH